MNPQDPTSRADPSGGWEAAAGRFVADRSPTIGVATVRTWARSFPPGASVLDLGCGSGVPISQALIEDGFDVWGVEAAPTLASAFRRRFPGARVACEAVEASDFFGRTFDGVLAIGLVFLLPAEAQRDLLRRVARALDLGGRFLFTAPTETGTWRDRTTGRESRSLGADAYTRLLAVEGLIVTGESVDEGGSHYYDAVRADGSRPGSAA